MLDIDVSNIFNILLSLFEKLSENKNVVSAYNQLAFSMLLEHLLNSNPRLLLTMLPAEQLNTFKSLINIVRNWFDFYIARIILYINTSLI